jgi:hypothetical protein
MAGLVQYFNNVGAGKDGRHTPITNWFFWAWNDNTPGGHTSCASPSNSHPCT